MLNEQATDGIMLGTFHSICARILRREVEHLPLESNFVIFDSDDQERIVKSIIKEFGLAKDNKDDESKNKFKNEDEYRASKVLAAISRAKNEMITAENYLVKIDTPHQKYEENVKRIYKEYQKRLVASNAVDFDDLLVYAVRLLKENPTVREKYAQRFRHVLVDEFQDTNLVQYELVKQLASHHKNIFCVGDPDQSVYGWRGADYRNIQRFQEDFPDTQEILLEQNYRSKQNILDAAMGVIDRASNRRKKRIFSERGAGDKIILHEAYNEYDEASFVVDNIVQLAASKQFDLGECAVMYRTNAMSRLIEQAFLDRRLSYKLVGAQKFYGRREVKDIISFLRLVHNPADEASLDRVINIPPRKIGDVTLLKLHNIARQNNTQPGFILLDLANESNSPYWSLFSKAGASLADFSKLLTNWRAEAQSLSLPELFDRIITDLNYKDYIDDNSEKGIDRWENIQELRHLTEEYLARPLEEFLENVALISDQDTLAEGNAPTLLTLHAAKGLEFGVVFIIGLNKGILPHDRSLNDPDGMEEERRLFYVGITRAKDRLYLVHALERSASYGPRPLRDVLWSQDEEDKRSPFLNDIPADLLAGKTRTGRPTSSFSSSRSFSRTPSLTESKYAVPPPPKSAPVANLVSSKFKSGDRIKHASFGEGIVQESRIQDNDEIVVIEFKSVGLKRLAASLANLTLL